MLKKSPYFRQFLILLVYIFLWPINFFIAPLLWMLGVVNKVRDARTPFLIWFVNTDEPDHKQNNYGDNNYLQQRGISDILTRGVFFRFYRYMIWSVFRNSYFYFKLNVIKPKELEPVILKVHTNTVFGPNATRDQNLYICEYTDRGKIHVLEERDGTQYFRYSFTKEYNFIGLKKIKILKGKVPFWYTIKQRYIWNVQLGVNGLHDMWGNRSTNRYMYKSRFKKI